MRLILAIVIALCIIGTVAFIGLHEDLLMGGSRGSSASSTIATIIPGVPDHTYANSQYGFSIRSPESASSSVVSYDGYLPVTQTSVASFALPESMFAGTNLAEAGVYIGATTTHSIVTTCTSASRAYDERAASSTNIGGQRFFVFTSTGVGAGNIYDEKVLRTVQNGACIEIAELLHSGNIGNYPPGAVVAFDRAKFSAILEGIVQTYHPLAN